MVAELVETSRLWGRTAARIDPQWVEPLAEHLRQAHATTSRAGSASAAPVVATERVTLYGLPIVAGPHGRLRRASTRSCRASCSSAARWSRATGTRGTRSSPTTARLLEEVEALEERARRRDILVDDQALFDFYDARIPADVVSGAHFDRWWRDERRARARAARRFTRELLVDRGAREDVDRRARPTAWRQGELDAAR